MKGKSKGRKRKRFASSQLLLGGRPMTRSMRNRGRGTALDPEESTASPQTLITTGIAQRKQRRNRGRSSGTIDAKEESQHNLSLPSPKASPLTSSPTTSSAHSKLMGEEKEENDDGMISPSETPLPPLSGEQNSGGEQKETQSSEEGEEFELEENFLLIIGEFHGKKKNL